MMPHLSIRASVIFLSILLLAILTTSLVLLSREIGARLRSPRGGSRLCFYRQERECRNKHFGDLRYWLTDFARPCSRDRSRTPQQPRRLDSDLRGSRRSIPWGSQRLGAR